MVCLAAAGNSLCAEQKNLLFAAVMLGKSHLVLILLMVLVLMHGRMSVPGTAYCLLFVLAWKHVLKWDVRMCLLLVL